jgi:hypothetical protein
MSLSRDVWRLVGSISQWINLIFLSARHLGPRAVLLHRAKTVFSGAMAPENSIHRREPAKSDT